jgi:hypothetical protein
MLDDEDDVDRGDMWKRAKVETPEQRLDRLFVPHEGTAKERADQIAARRAGQKLWAEICDLLRKKVL